MSVGAQEQQIEIEALASQVESEADDFQPIDKPAGKDVAPVDSGSGEMCASLYMTVFSVLGEARGAHWHLTIDQAKQLGESTGAVMDKYFPAMPNSVELTLLLALGMVIYPKYTKDQEIQQQKSIEREVRKNGDKSESITAD